MLRRTLLRSVPGVLHVMLSGPREARIRQGMRLEGVGRRVAERRQDAHDYARVDYVRRLYGVDPDDPDLFHLRLDSTVIDLPTWAYDYELDDVALGGVA